MPFLMPLAIVKLSYLMSHDVHEILYRKIYAITLRMLAMKRRVTKQVIQKIHVGSIILPINVTLDFIFQKLGEMISVIIFLSNVIIIAWNSQILHKAADHINSNVICLERQCIMAITA